MASTLYLLPLLLTQVSAQSIQDFGVSGGDGPTGGIGDAAHPVLQAQAFITDGMVPLAPNTTRQLARGDPPVLVRNGTGCSTRRSIVVDSTPKGARQEMLGFGHAWTDSATDVFDSLEPDLQDQVMRDLFGQEGNNMGFMRHTIGSSDLSAEAYSYDDNGPSFNEGEPDYGLLNFSLGPHGTRMAEWIARMGKYKGDVSLIGATWSYPGWMKNNGLFIAPNTGGSHVLGNNSFNPRYMPQAIEYFTKYVDAFKAHGVNINGMSLQNEPLNYQGGTTTMYLDAVDAAAMINQGLGEAMQQRDVKILAYDHNTDQPAYPYRQLQGAEDKIGATAWHCYQGPVAEYEVLQDNHYAFPAHPQFMTECSNTGVTAGTKNLWVAQNFIPAVANGSSGAVMWVMATDPNYGPRSPYGGCTTCLGSIVVNSSTVYTKQIDYYMIGQFSRFIRRGAVNHNIPVGGRQGSGTDWDSQFFVIATKNPDGGWAVVFLCNLPDDQEIELSFTGSGHVWQGTLPSNTLVTWLLPSDEVLARNSTSTSTVPTPPYAFGNGTVPISVPTGSGLATGTGLAGTGSASVCSATLTSAATSAASSTGTLVPVPHTDHTISSS